MYKRKQLFSHWKIINIRKLVMTCLWRSNNGSQYTLEFRSYKLSCNQVTIDENVFFTNRGNDSTPYNHTFWRFIADLSEANNSSWRRTQVHRECETIREWSMWIQRIYLFRGIAEQCNIKVVPIDVRVGVFSFTMPEALTQLSNSCP